MVTLKIFALDYPCNWILLYRVLSVKRLVHPTVSMDELGSQYSQELTWLRLLSRRLQQVFWQTWCQCHHFIRAIDWQADHPLPISWYRSWSSNNIKPMDHLFLFEVQPLFLINFLTQSIKLKLFFFPKPQTQMSLKHQNLTKQKNIWLLKQKQDIQRVKTV